MKYREITDTDLVQPLHYYEERDVYHVPAFVMPGRLCWFRDHSEDDLYIRSLDVGIYEIGRLRGGKVPSAKKITVECPDEPEVPLQPVTHTILFCPSCAPHKFVQNGQIMKKHRATIVDLEKHNR